MPRQRRQIPWLKVRDGVHYVYWYDDAAGRTKRLSLGTADSVEAQQRYAAFLAKGHEGFRPGGTAGLTVSQALDDYWREHVVPNVVDRQRAEVVIRHLKAYFKDTPIKDIDIPAGRGYAEARRMGVVGGGERRKSGEGGDSTIRRELTILVAAANHALRWRRITPAELPSIELPKEDMLEPVSDADWLTVPELVQALAKAEGRIHDFIMVAYYTAGRRRSIEKLARVQVDLANSRINLRSPTETPAQRRSKKRRPIVPIDPLLRPTVEQLLIANKDSPWLFGDTRDMYRPFQQHMTAIGLEHKSNPHILRHSRATHLLHSGVSIYDVAKLLGDTVATVEKVYGHHSPEYLAQAIGGRG